MTGTHRRPSRASRPTAAGSHRADPGRRPLKRIRLLPVTVAALLVATGTAATLIPRTQNAADASPSRPTAATDPASEPAQPATESAEQHHEPQDSLPVNNEPPATTPTPAPTPVDREGAAGPTGAESRPARARVAQRLPEAGSGDFVTVDGSTETTGTGALVTYQVEVEREVPLNPTQVAATVDRTLRDPRGWTASGAHALARVDSEGSVRVLLASPETTDQLCAPLDTGGRLSCRNGNLVVLNAWRWLNGADSYAGDLRNYRRYLINHEMGHALGNGHEDCPERGAIAPVMMQQTKGVGECVNNPWPAPGDRATTRSVSSGNSF